MTSRTGSTPGALTPDDAPALPRRQAWGRLLVWGIVASLIGLMGWQLVNSSAGQPAQGEAPDFTLTTYDGQIIQLADLRGQVVVVNFWASWCIPCIDEAPELEATWQTYKDRGVVLLGIDYLDTERNGLDFLAEHGITYPNGPDLRQSISDDYRITGVPETFVIDRAGNVTFHGALPITREVLSQEIERAMAAGG